MNLRGVITDATLDQLRNNINERRQAIVQAMGRSYVLHADNQVQRRDVRRAGYSLIRL